MKKHEALEALQRLLAQGLRSSADKSSAAAPRASSSQPQAPAFEFLGWQFFPLTGPFDDEELNDGGDGKLRAPNGSLIGLVWTASGKLAHRFDFTPSFGPMLYVDVPAPIRTWSDLRPYFESLAPALEAELHQHESPQ